MRSRGTRIKVPRAADDWVEGFVSFAGRRTAARSFDCVVFRRIIDAHPVPNWRELFEPRLTSIGDGTLWLRGFESHDGAAVVQEWRLDVQRAVKPGGRVGPPLGEIKPGRR